MRETIEELGRERHERIYPPGFRITMKRVIKPRDPADLADILYAEEDGPCEE